MKHRVIIHGAMLGGYPFVLILVALLILTPASIWLYPAQLVRWLIAAAMIFAGAVVAEAIVRRTFVEVDGERIRWFFRQPPTRGDEPVANLRGVTIYPESGALLEFADGSSRVMLGIGDFRQRDITRVVQALLSLGVPVDNSRGPVESLIDVLLGRTSSRR